MFSKQLQWGSSLAVLRDLPKLVDTLNHDKTAYSKA